jgi:hypothetical protein
VLWLALAVPSCLVGVGDVSEENEKSDSGSLDGSAGAGGSVGGTGGVDASTGGTGGSSTGGAPSGGTAGAALVDAGDAGSGCPLALTDDFEDGVPASFWQKLDWGGALTSETNGVLGVALPSTVTTSTFGGYLAKSPFDLAGCSMQVHVVKTPALTITAYAHFALFYENDDYAEIIKTGDAIHFQHFVGGALHHLAQVKFDSDVQAFWRFRSLGGVLNWETSPDGTSWTTQAVAILSSKFDRVRIGAGAYQNESGITGGAVFDEFGTLAL